MFFVQPTGLVGFTPSEITLNAVNRSGSTKAKGALVMLDLGASVAEITTSSAASYNAGAENSVWDSFTAVSALGVKCGILGIVTEKAGIANDARGAVTYYGLIDALVVNSNTLLKPFQSQLVAKTSGVLDITPASNERVIAFYEAPQASSSSTAVLRQVLFNGITGFGRPNPST